MNESNCAQRKCNRQRRLLAASGPLRLPDRSKNRVGAARPGWQNAQMNDYERIERIIRYLDAHHITQPDLARLAKHSGLSPFHFHRLFSVWAGITPKDFLQCLTLSHARQSLREDESVLDAALGAGLSGPGRLHDLCVNLEAASPGEIKSGGAGWTIQAGFAETPFGKCLIGEGPRGICHLSFVGPGKERIALNSLREEWPHARLRRDDAAAFALAARIFEQPAGQASRPALRALVRGTAFQIRVWQALLRVQPGTLVSYGFLAGMLGQPAAARAVGAAAGANPLAFLIPCHRVIRQTGIVGGYRWGSERKRAIMAWESSQRFAPAHPISAKR